MKLFQRTQNVLGIKGEIMPYEQRSNLKNYIKKSQKINNTVKRKLNFEKTYIKEYHYMSNLISEDNEKENNNNININNNQNNSMINIKSKNYLNLKEKKIE